jgi:hypothetical protein
MTPKKSATILAPQQRHLPANILKWGLFNLLEWVNFRPAYWPFVQWQDSGLWIR